MFDLKKILVACLVILTSALPWCALKAEQDAENGRWLEVYFEDLEKLPSQYRDYSKYREDRPDGIAILKMNVKLIPDPEGSTHSLVGYKAELALNSHARENAISTSDEYQISFFISFLDEDGFCLDLLDTTEPGLHTSRFRNLQPGGKPQIQQAVFFLHQISPSLAKRIKTASVSWFMEMKTRKHQSNKPIKE